MEDAANEAGEESFLSIGRDVAYYHHERWDGKGYPFHLKDEEIPLAARIVSLADVYDALTTRRRYKQACAHQDAVLDIKDARGSRFDPEIVDAFLEVESEFNHIREEFSRTGDETSFAACILSGEIEPPSTSLGALIVERRPEWPKLMLYCARQSSIERRTCI